MGRSELNCGFTTVALICSICGGDVHAAKLQFTLQQRPRARERYPRQDGISEPSEEEVGHEDGEQRPAALQEVGGIQFDAPTRLDLLAHAAMSSAHPRTARRTNREKSAACRCCRAAGPCRSGSAHVPMTLHY